MVVLLAIGCSVPAAAQQESADPASDSKVIEETLSKIRQVEDLEKFISENTSLKSENEQLKQQIASLDEQVKKLTEELRVENERLRMQLVQMPTFRIKSKLVGSSGAMAILDFGEKSIRIRQDVELSVPVADGVWTLMKVLKISNDFIELEFPELERTVLLYD
jgi:predicted RNase H-like nuclease (RuvC/YqgF family)